jgi:hypothetical protein
VRELAGEQDAHRVQALDHHFISSWLWCGGGGRRDGLAARSGLLLFRPVASRDHSLVGEEPLGQREESARVELLDVR